MILNKLESLLYSYGVDLEFIKYWGSVFNYEIKNKTPLDDNNLILSTLDICFDLTDEQIIQIKITITKLQGLHI